MSAASTAVAPAAVVLAAGQGKRMRSKLPKVAHEVAGRPMVAHVVRAALQAGAARIVVVVGVGEMVVRRALADDLAKEQPDAPLRYARQDRQLGTGHALACAETALADHQGSLFVLNGDGPLVRPETLARMAAVQRQEPVPERGATLLTLDVTDPTGLGRIERDAEGNFLKITEHRDATAEVRAIREVNPGVYLFDDSAFARCDALQSDNAGGERYLTDLPASYLRDGLPVRTVRSDDPEEGLAANDRAQLAQLERIMRLRVVLRHQVAGVTVRAPEACWIDDDVVIAQDVVIEPLVTLRRGTRVGEDAWIGTGAHLTGCTVEAGAEVAPYTVAVGRTFAR